MRKPVVEWEGFYEVSDAGDVFSLERIVRRRDGTIQTWKARKMSPMNRDGYRVVRLSQPGRRVSARVHRLVAESFIPNDNNLPEVNHLNGDRWDSRVENLEWTTPSGNRLHAARILGTVDPPHRKGEAANRAKLTDSAVAEMRLAHRRGVSARELARRYGVAHKTIQQALKGQSWAHVPLPDPPEG